MEQLISIASQFGAVGLIMLACGWYIVTREKDAKAERDQMQQRHTNERREQHEEIIAIAKEGTQALNNNTSVLSELKTIIRERNS